MNNAGEYNTGDPDIDVDPLNQQEQETVASPYTSYEAGEITMASGEESFLLESDQANESQDHQRSSTPTANLAHFADGEQFPIQEVVLSPVLKPVAKNTTADDDQDKSPRKQLFHSSEGYSVQDNSAEESQSLYTSALSNVNTSETSDGYSAEKQRIVVSSSFEVSTLQNTLCNESLGESSTQDATWATACGSLQGNSNLKDVTIRQEFAQSSLSSNLEDSNNEDNAGLTYEDMPSTVEDDHDSHHVRNGDLLDAMNSDRTASVEENSPDLELLNEICEEATNMTIKEALICSLNPGVRAGLREGRLSLNESEILALEQYCEQFIDDLISQLLEGHWSEKIHEEPSKTQHREHKAKVAQKLSSLGLETLKSNCDRFVHSIITESLHDSCFGFKNKDEKSLESDRAVSAKQRKKDAVDENSVQILLPLFKASQAIQDYIGFLAADVIKSALANLSTSIVTKNGEKNDHMTLSKNSSSDHKANTGSTLCFSKGKEQKERTQVSVPNNDMWYSQSDVTVRSIENETQKHKLSVNVDDDFEERYARETEYLSDDEHLFSSSLNGALETSMEFDAGDWEGGGFLEDFHSLDTESKQKIVLRELSFDEHADVAGTEVLAPVFLAIAEENDNDTEIQGMRKKALSIEDLCGVIDEPVKKKSIQRSYSAPKRITPVRQTTESESEFLLGGDSGEKQSSDEEYQEDEKSDIADEEAGDDVEENKLDQEQDGQGQEKTAEPKRSPDHGERFRWHTVSVSGREKILDLKLLEPYMKVISHGGYFSNTKATIVVIAACYLPDRSLTNYDYLMEQLFFYVISTLELLAIHEDYYLVYLNGGTRQQNMPSVTWMKRFYQYIEGGLKKRMKEMYIVHPTFRLKAVITLAKPFLNANFWRKLSFVHSLGGLSIHIPVDYIYIPDEVMRVDPDYRLAHNQ